MIVNLRLRMDMIDSPLRTAGLRPDSCAPCRRHRRGPALPLFAVPQQIERLLQGEIVGRDNVGVIRFRMSLVGTFYPQNSISSWTRRGIMVGFANAKSRSSHGSRQCT